MAGSVTRRNTVLPATNSNQISNASGSISGTGDAYNGLIANAILLIDENNPAQPISPADDRSLQTIIGAVAHGTDTLTVGVVGPSIAATILQANANRKEYTVVNPSSAILYLGPANVSTTVYKVALPPTGTYINDRDKGAVWAISSSGTINPMVTETA